MKLIGDVFKDKVEYVSYIVETTWDHIVYPNKVRYFILDDMDDSVRNSMIKNGTPEIIVDNTLASFNPINDKGLKRIKEGKGCDDFKPEHIAMLMIYTNRLEKEINLDLDISPKDMIKLILLHECRHAQQFFYIMDKFNDHNLYENLIMKDNKLNGDCNYYKSILESDAEAYAYKHALNKERRTVAGSLNINKVMNYLINKIVNSK